MLHAQACETQEQRVTCVGGDWRGLNERMASACVRRVTTVSTQRSAPLSPPSYPIPPPPSFAPLHALLPCQRQRSRCWQSSNNNNKNRYKRYDNTYSTHREGLPADGHCLWLPTTTTLHFHGRGICYTFSSSLQPFCLKYQETLKYAFVGIILFHYGM